MVDVFKDLKGAKGTWATKWVNWELLHYDPQGKTRIRFSLMPAHVAKVVDVRTSPMEERIASISDFAAAGYEVHINFSPVILTETWLEDYAKLFEEMNYVLSDEAKEQLAAEVIFLTHKEGLHEQNLLWHPKDEELLWTPQNQETKRSETGGLNVRYRHGFKGMRVRQLLELMESKIPYVRVRYAFCVPAFPICLGLRRKNHSSKYRRERCAVRSRRGAAIA